MKLDPDNPPVHYFEEAEMGKFFGNLVAWWSSRAWRRRQREFKRTGTSYYGGYGTVRVNVDGHHDTLRLDVEVYRGEVVAVWFRCRRVPFFSTTVKADRAREMRKAFDGLATELHGIEVRDVEL